MDKFGNIVIILSDKVKIQYHSTVQYVKRTNKIYPPLNSIISPTVTCLKGQINNLGASLEKAPWNLIYIGRSLNMGGWKLNKSKWNNPFTVKQYGRDLALQKYREYILSSPELLNSLSELNGKILACWCPSSFECHGGILVDLYQQYVK